MPATGHHFGAHVACILIASGKQAGKPDAETRTQTQSMVHIHLFPMCHREDEMVGLPIVKVSKRIAESDAAGFINAPEC